MAKRNKKDQAPNGDTAEAEVEAPDLETSLRSKLNIKTDFEPLPEGTERQSSFSDAPAAYRRANRYYSAEEYARCNARREKLEQRLAKQMERSAEEAEAAEAA